MSQSGPESDTIRAGRNSHVVFRDQGTDSSDALNAVVDGRIAGDALDDSLPARYCPMDSIEFERVGRMARALCRALGCQKGLVFGDGPA